MARSSRHKSHRSHKHRDRSDSEDEGTSESARVSRVSDQEKRKPSSKDGVGTSNGDLSEDHGRKRKDRGEDRRNVGGDDDSRVEKTAKNDEIDADDLEKSVKSRSSSSRRREGSREKEERRSEKGASRKEKEKEKEREKGSSGKEKKVQDSRRERSSDGARRREENCAKQGVEISELQNEMHNPDPEVEKELDKRSERRKDGSGAGREGDEGKVSSRDDNLKKGSYKDERYKEKYREGLEKEKYREEVKKEKCREELDRDQSCHNDKRRDDRFSRTCLSERSDSKHYRDDQRVDDKKTKPQHSDGSRHADDKKTKLHDSDRDGIRHVDDYSPKTKDNRGTKRSTNELEDQNDMKPQSTKERHKDNAKNGSGSCSDRARLEHLHIDDIDSTLSNSQTKDSPNSSSYAGKDRIRHNSRQAESMCRESLSGDMHNSYKVSRDHTTASGGREKICTSRSFEKSKLKDDIQSDVVMTDSGYVPHRDRILRSDSCSSASQVTGKSPISTSDRRSERITSRHSLEIKEGEQRSSSSKGGRGDTSFNGRELEYFMEKPNKDDTSQLGSNRSTQLQDILPGNLPPPLPVRTSIDGPGILGSYEDEAMLHNGEHKISTRYKRGASMGRGPGTPWKNTPTWPSPVANGFMPFQHGPPSGFHPDILQFPPPHPFGIRPSMDLNNPSFHIYEGNRFTGHARPFGWHSPNDYCPPHSQIWDGNTNVFGDESNIFVMQEQDQNRHLLSSKGWEMNNYVWNGQNANAKMYSPVPQKEHEYPRQPLAEKDQPIADVSVVKLLCDLSSAKQVVGTSSKSLLEKTPDLHEMLSVNDASEKKSSDNFRYCCTYLSKLDISLDLVHPELYNQCISLMKARERNVTSNIPNQGERKSNVEFRLVTKSKQFARKSLFPTATDSTFQRAMSLYRKQKEGLKEAMHFAIPSVYPGQASPPKSDDEEKTSEALPANAPAGDYMDRNKSTALDAERERQNAGDGDEKRCDNPSNTDEQHVVNSNAAEVEVCDNISDAVISVERPKGSEGIIPECRLNPSRIHLSAEITH
ncbi:uncharacterized protein LOC109847463 [Asparagus officinalis]|nr:uncharacterized protein LOC109847463 [Asparagus officinalis]